MIKYKAQWFARPEINRVEVIRETPTQVVLERRREAQSSESHFYGETYRDARNWLLGKCLKRKANAEKEIARQKYKIAQADIQFDKISKFKED